MGEKRRSKRYPKRLKVAFGEQDYSASAFTLNISKSGAFIVCPQAVPVGALVHVKLFGEAKSWAALEAQVRWRKEVPLQLRQLQHGGIGIRFLPAHEVVERLLPPLQSERRFEVLYTTPEELQSAFAQELKFGGVFIRTEQMLPRDADVVVEVRLEFQQRVLELPARVMQAMAADPSAGREAGLALMFVDAAEALKQLQAFF